MGVKDGQRIERGWEKQTWGGAFWERKGFGGG
jgi:hypothetical protein